MRLIPMIVTAMEAEFDIAGHCLEFAKAALRPSKIFKASQKTTALS